MKKSLTYLTLCLLCFCACRKTPTVGNTTKPSPDYQKAVSFLDKQNDSAFYYFNKTISGNKDHLQTAMAYNYMARIQSDAGDFFGSQESLSLSLKFLNPQDKKDWRCLSSDYNELGLTSISLKNYGMAVGFFDQAIRYVKENKFRLSFLNNKALAYQKKGNYQDALKIYQTTIGQATRKETYSRILSNMARTKWLADPRYNAAPELLTALHIREKENDLWGQNASFIHLSDYYAAARPDSGLLYARKEYAVAQKLNSPDDELEALQKLIKLSQPSDTKTYFQQYQVLSDSVQTARNAAKNQFALIRYDVAQQKTANLQLQKDNSERKFQLTLLLVVLVAVIIGSFLRYRRIRLKALEKLRQNELRLSQKVHDVVANGIYRVMNEVEHGPVLDKEQLLDQLELMYEQSRDITYEKDAPVSGDFAEKITTLLNAFKSGGIKLAVSGNETALWQAVRPGIQTEVAPMLQELMVNMTKHSRASQALVAFEINNHTLLIDYRDNGVGLPEHFYEGNGLRNTGNRIKALRGDLKFVKEAAGGARIQLLIPLS